ncbi:carbamate kinase, partial [Candidatus Poribacteria bacterium]|nr:carbamate kinase [Candidatus Poribacteria bacterium]
MNTMPHGTVLIALGGNAIIAPGEEGTLDQQYERTRVSMAEMARLLKSGVIENFILTHGNGPQVGNIILRSEYSLPVLYPLSVDVCVSDSQGGMGYMLQQCLCNAFAKEGVNRVCATIVTQ